MKRFLLLLCTVCTLSGYAAEQISIADFLSIKSTTTDYRLQGEVQMIANTTYGNFYLRDNTGSIYIYGLLDEDGYPKNFASLNIVEGDVLTLEGKYTEKNNAPRIADAQYISHIKSPWTPEAISFADFIDRNDGRRYILKGTVTSIADATKGYFYIKDIKDESASLYVFGLSNFSSFGVEVGDTITLKGCYELYGTKNEVVAAQFVALSKYVWTPVPIDIASFIAKNDGNVYIITGKVTSIQNSVSGNFVLQDKTGSLTIWGLVDKDNNKVFSMYDIEKGDTVSVQGIYYHYVNGEEEKDEIQNALFLSHTIVLPDDGIHFPASFRKGWDMYMGQTLTFKDPFYVVEVPSRWDSLTISTERLQIPDEVSYKLASGDSTYYKQHAARNASYKIALKGIGDGYFNSNDFRCGAVLYPLRAKVVGERDLVLEEALPLYNYTPVTTPPDMPDATIKVCGANIENYYVTLGSFGAKDDAQFANQTKKIASALINIDADIYALCELESYDAAVATLVAKMNELAGTDRYAYERNGLPEYSAQSVGFVYRTDKVAVTSASPYFPYTEVQSPGWNKRLIMREFKELSSDETFVISINHLKAKTSDGWVSTQYSNTTYLLNGLEYITSNSWFANDRVLILGDFNSYTYEGTVQRMIAAGYKDILPHDNPLEDYSYVYHGETGYLDRAFASEDLLEYIVDVRPYHVNADYHYRHEYKYEPSTLYRYSDHDPILVGINFSGITTTTDNIQTASQAVKVIIDGTLYIINNGVRYTVTGLVVE